MAEQHAVITGPIKGPVQLADGTQVDVSAPIVYVDSIEQAAEVAHAIGQHWAKHGHPDDFDIDEKTGDRIQRKFAYDDAHHRKHGKKKGR